jgi:hypothetical protein
VEVVVAVVVVVVALRAELDQHHEADYTEEAEAQALLKQILDLVAMALFV